MPYDKFGVKIICRHCASRNFRCDHHPSECKTCRICGTVGHDFKDCLKARSKSISPKRLVEVDNTHNLLPNEAVSIDVEKVQSNGTQLAAFVAVCQWPSDLKLRRRQRDPLIYSAKIRRLRSEVTNYATPWSGLSAIDLSEQSLPIGEVQRKLEYILKDRVVVGIGLKEDLRSLGLENLVHRDNYFDFLDHFRDELGKPIALKYLAYGILGKRIQEFAETRGYVEGHDPIIDSRITIKIYRERKHPNNAKVDGSYQWIRNLVDEAIESGYIIRK